MRDNKQSIFSVWLKQFIALVFTQSFQAIFMVFSLKVMAECISGVSDISVSSDSFTAEGTGYFICSIIAYVSITALVKMEKLIKQLFAFEDSPILGDMSKNMKDLMHSAMHLSRMGSSVMGGVKQIGAAKSEAKKQSKIYDRKKAAGLFKEVTKGSTDILGGKGSIGIGDGKGGAGKSESVNINVSQLGKAISGAINKSSERGDDYWGDDSKFGADGRPLSEEEQQIRKIMAAKQNVDLAKRTAVLRTMSAIGALGVANGGSDSLEEAAHAADYLYKGLSTAGDKVARVQSNRAAHNMVAEEINKTNKEIENIKQEVVRDMKSGKSGSVARAAEIKKAKDSYNKALTDLTNEMSSTMNTTLIQEIRDSAKNWADTVDYVPKVASGERIKKESKKIIRDAQKKYGDNKNQEGK